MFRLAGYWLMPVQVNGFGGYRVKHRQDRFARLGEFDRPVVVAMISVGMVQVTVDKIVDVVAMWHSLVTASGAMNVVGRMRTAVMTGVHWSGLFALTSSLCSST